LPAAYFIEREGMTEFNLDDLDRLQYVFVARDLLTPAEDSIGFEGQVWMIIGAGSASATVNAALIGMQAGVITVGDNTSGVTGPEMRYVPLPNTGILWRIDQALFTDSDGNIVEVYGVIPQIPSRHEDGMDALETVLAHLAELAE
jgi:C-terminal processing protease CtpA/Prc